MEHGIVSAGLDTNCFNIVMSSWLKSGDIASERCIRQIFEYMDECRRRGCDDLRPDASAYNIVISSIAPAVKERLDASPPSSSPSQPSANPMARARAERGDRAYALHEEQIDNQPASWGRRESGGMTVSTKNKLTISLRVGERRERGRMTV